MHNPPHFHDPHTRAATAARGRLNAAIEDVHTELALMLTPGPSEFESMAVRTLKHIATMPSPIDPANITWAHPDAIKAWRNGV